MRTSRPPVPDDAQWESSLLAMDTEILLATARNYLGPIKTPYDKRVLISRLATFLRKPETRAAIISLLDGLDARILGTMLLSGPLPEALLREFFRDELRVFDLGLKISNLQERLLLFRIVSAREIFLSVNPILVPDLAPLILNASIILGWKPPSTDVEVHARRQTGSSASGELSGVDLMSAFFGLIHNYPGSLRKSGGLSKRSLSRVAELLPGLAAYPARLEAMIRGLHAAGALVRDEEGEGGLEADSAAFSELLSRWKGFLPLRVAAALATAANKGSTQERVARAEVLAHFLVAALDCLPCGADLAPTSLRRWLGIAAFRMGIEQDSASIGALVEVLGELGLPDAPMLNAQPLAAERVDRPGIPVIVAEGSHLLHVLPEAGSEDRWFALLLAEPRGFGRVWELELDRESMRRAFASGLTGLRIVTRLEALGARALPQSLAFSISSWEQEYRSLRLYHGFVLVCDERKRNLLERNPSLASLVMEKLGDGVYILAARGAEEIRERLSAAGIEAPPEIHSHAATLDRAYATIPLSAPSSFASSLADTEAMDHPSQATLAGREAARLRREAAALWTRIEDESEAGRSFDPSPLIEALKVELARVKIAGSPANPAAEVAKELTDRVERRLILDAAQLGRAELRIERLEAGGMDYSGKTRIVERALRQAGDRLEIHYQLSGASASHAIVRPVRLEKTDKGLVLEAEDLETGGPLRVPLGAASSVRRLRAAFFGDEA